MDGQPFSPVTMTTYDALGNQLDTQTISTVPAAQWASNWIGSQIGPNQQPISKVVFSGIDFGVDNLTTVPLPPSVMLLGNASWAWAFWAGGGEAVKN